MAAEITYAEVRFKTESSSPKSDSPTGKKIVLVSVRVSDEAMVFFQKYSQLLEEKNTVKGSTQKHTALECKRSNSPRKDKVWSCCPKDWKSFSSHCYFYPTEAKSWNESVEHCSSMEAHLVVITSKEEQDFITQNMNPNTAYYVGLSDPQGQRHWQWVDQTPYNESATFWHHNEPNDRKEHCVMLNYRALSGQWGWNDARCELAQGVSCFEGLTLSLVLGLSRSGTFQRNQSESPCLNEREQRNMQCGLIVIVALYHEENGLRITEAPRVAEESYGKDLPYQVHC
ncbi:C-type lectin domain family 4 member A-like [Erethizon dorsatum]